MNQLDRSSRVSALYDGEVEGEERGAVDHQPGVVEQLRFFEWLSILLCVPADVGESDPNFVARFRALRDAMTIDERWRLLTLRLVPLTAFAVLLTGVVLWASNDGPSAMEAFEVLELGAGIGEVTADTAIDEPVLRIAFGDL